MKREIPTFCRVCEPSCGLVAQVEDERLVGLAPDRDHPVTKGFACHKGLAGLDVHRDPDRLNHPLRRTDKGVFERAHWDEAVAAIAGEIARLRDRYGPDSVGTYIGNPSAFNTTVAPAARSFLSQLGTRRTFGSGTQDCSNKFAGSEAVFGSSTIHPVPDVEHTDHLLILGANPRVSHMSFFSIADPVAKLRAIRKRGGTVRIVNPRRVEPEGSSVGEVVLIRPDTDLYLLAALLHTLESEGRIDRERLAAHGKRVEELFEFVRAYPAERAAGITGIDAETIRQLAREFAAASSASIHMSTGLNMGRQGTLCYWLVHMLSFATGNLDRRGGNLYATGFYPAAKAGRIDPERTYFDSPFGRIRRVRGDWPGNLLPDVIEADEDPLRALVVISGNPVLTVGGEERMRRALEQLELLVVIDLYRNATGEYAHWLLPATDMFERPDINLCGLGMQQQPFVQYTDAVVPPQAERKPEWWALARIEQALGMKSVLDAGEEPPLFQRIDHMLAKSGLSIEGLRALPQQTAVLPEPETGRFFDEWIQTDDRRVDCCPPLFREALAGAEAICRELEAEDEGQLKLITRRDEHMHNSWYHNVPKLKGRRHRSNPLYMNPRDAEARGLGEGDVVRVASDSGAIEVEIAFDDALMPGVVALTHGWGNAQTPGMSVAQAHPGVNGNRLLPIGPGSFDPLSNQAFMTGIPVDVVAV
ncbi:MAG: molybdopterin-dependent oxidoreductase [Proteobacteria bacterium]|nr:molybdopterin-dependent oxidoreductase [Pseudomonadota bacterium]